MTVHTDLYLDGAWQRAAVPDGIQVEDPATEQVVGAVPAAHAMERQ